MQKNSASHKFLRLFLAYFIAVSSFLIPFESYAVYEGVRGDIGFDDENNRCDTGSLKFDFFTSNDDYNMEFDNPVCITFMTITGVLLVLADNVVSTICRQAVNNPLNAAAVPAEEVKEKATKKTLPYPTPAFLVKMALKTTACGTRVANSIPACAGTQAPVTCPPAHEDVGMCCGALTEYGIAIAQVTAALSVIWDQAKNTYNNARICGHTWQKWEKQDADGNISADGKWKKVRGPHRRCLENLFLGTSYPGASGCENNNQRTIGNKSYREFIYGGIEFEDNGDGSCDNPSTWDDVKKRRILGYSSSKQRYYMTGPGAAPVYACHRFITKPANEADRSATQAAYDCCKRRSQNAICIENRSGLGNALGPYSHNFCEIGSRCSVSGIVLEAYASRTQPNYVCAKTYSVCPYNHLLGGGTEMKEYNTSDPSQVDNFCQFMNHCSKLPILPYIRTSSLDGGFISAACRDMKGDSQNVYGYTSDLIPINTRGFSAPMIQCFKETMENVFLNKAGHTECLNPDENPGDGDVCTSGYRFKKGYVMEGKSFFLKIQDSLQGVIKIALTLSIVLFGVAILFAIPKAYIERKTLLMYILKIGLVMYFAVGDAWQYGFMNNVLNLSLFMADLTFKVDESAPPEKLDGCQFPRYNYADNDDTSKYQNPAYPPGKEYLRVWDTLDCKIARALGFGPEVSVPNLVLMILGGFFTGGLGIIFFVGTFIFAFFLISLTLRALHIFLMSMTSVIILMYVSPITITLVLFNRTKSIFDGWWKQMLGFILQPMILFAYLGILITLFDKLIIGPDVTFTATATAINGQTVSDTYGRIVPKTIVCNSAAQDSSIYCIFRISDVKTFTGFEVLGIGIPILVSMNAAKLDTIVRAALLLFVFTQFMDKITGFAAALVGGAELKSNWGGMSSMAAKSFGALRAIQTRGMNAARKHGGKIARKGIEKGKEFMHNRGDKGKSLADQSDGKGDTHAVSSKDEERDSNHAVSTKDDNSGDDKSGAEGDRVVSSDGDKPDSDADKVVSAKDDTTSDGASPQDGGGDGGGASEATHAVSAASDDVPPSGSDDKGDNASPSAKDGDDSSAPSQDASDAPASSADGDAVAGGDTTASEGGGDSDQDKTPTAGEGNDSSAPSQDASDAPASSADGDAVAGGDTTASEGGGDSGQDKTPTAGDGNDSSAPSQDAAQVTPDAPASSSAGNSGGNSTKSKGGGSGNKGASSGGRSRKGSSSTGGGGKSDSGPKHEFLKRGSGHGGDMNKGAKGVGKSSGPDLNQGSRHKQEAAKVAQQGAEKRASSPPPSPRGGSPKKS